jgi:CRP/FNR family nitrogen fixation transcriptional regulator
MQILPQTKSLTCPCDHHRCRDSVNCICRTSVTASTTSGTIRALARRAKLFTDGNDDSDVFYKVVSGTVCTYKILNDGRRQITDFHSESEYFGLEMGIGQSLLGHAVVDTKLSVFSRDRLRMPCPGDAEFRYQVTSDTIRRLERAQHHFLLLGRMTAQERIAAFLLDMAERFSAKDHFHLPMSRSDIADFLGLTIETVSRTLTHLSREGVIELAKNGRSVRLLKKKTLQHQAA